MELDDLVFKTSNWLKSKGPKSELVLSSRIRLARNLENLPFPHWAKKKDLLKIAQRIRPVLKKDSHFKNGILVEMENLDSLDRDFLVERHLISPEYERKEGRFLIIGEGEVISIMVNEEDHLRIQVLESGLQLRDCWLLINQLDEVLNEAIGFAFDADWGYLTACPTNLGTGMRASVMVHLPGLAITREIHRVLPALTKLGIVVRGFYGEGSEAKGNVFQISNGTTLGKDEEEIVAHMESLMKQLIGYEETARKNLLSREKNSVENKVWRAYGILQNSRLLTSQESISLLSTLRLGVELSIVNLKMDLINELDVLTLPAHIQKIMGKSLSPQERDRARGKLVRDRLKKE